MGSVDIHRVSWYIGGKKSWVRLASHSWEKAKLFSIKVSKYYDGHCKSLGSLR